MLECHFPSMIERSRCPKCKIRMMRVGVERSFAGPDLRTLECPKCGLARRWQRTNETENKAGWLKSELGRGK
jgi:ssDNA-binding Zn-finger/Zn-ribbon topoisomerase 1